MNMIDRMEKSFAQVVCAGVAIMTAPLARGGTVAYWPMEMNPATGGTSRTIADASGNNYTLEVKLTDAEVTNSTDVAFSRPPNGPAEVTASSCAEIVNGTSLTKSPFWRGSGDQSQTSDSLIRAMGLRHDFTIEGYMYVKSLKHVPVPADAETIIAYSGVDGTGDWMWYMLETGNGSNKRKVILKPRKSDLLVLATIDDAEILGGWHHYSLVFKFDEDGSNSRWTFYLDGVNRGSQLMPNRASDKNVQHDRFQLGGANSSAKKEIDAKFAFWRVSDEALSSDSLLCHQTFSTTVAYWPMNVVSSLYNNVSQPIVPDVVDERNTLMVRDPSKGGVSWTDNDIGWTTPPNPDADLAAAGVSCWSKTMVRSGNNTTLIDSQYKPVFSTVASAPVIEATKLNKSFTIEGFLKFNTLPADNSKNQLFLYNTLGERGGWCWNLLGADGNGFLTMQVQTANDSNGSRTPRILGNRFRAEELLNVWNHYALTFTPDNGKGKTEWRFYLNGRLLGKNNDMTAYGDYDFTSPKFYMSGAGSGGNPQALCGDMTCWRVSNKALTPPEFLCGGETPVVPADALVWKGAVDSAEWSTGSVPNWIADGTPVSWTDAKDVYFDDTYATNVVEITGTVNPASINVIADSNLKLDFNKNRSSVIDAGCTNFVKRGFGTIEISYGGNATTSLVKGARPIEVREGCLRVNAANSNSALGDASLGYEVKVYDHATLSLYARNAIGSATPDVANDSVFTVYTNGIFDMTSSGFNIQPLGTLDLLGGNFIAPAKCHGVGYLLIRDRLTLGCNPGRRPYVFPIVRNEGDIDDIQVGITFGYNTEFRVEDITGDAASDGIFNCAVLARTAWQDAGHPCGFRKTGGGTMELNNPSIGSGGTQAKPTGVIAVEAGELKVNIDYSTPSKYTVADGAFLSGTGKVSRVEFAAGAGLRVDATKADILELTDADFAGGGVIELSGVAPAAIENLKVNCAKVGNPVTGRENLSNWKVKVNGVENPDLAVRIHGGFLKALVLKGMCIIYR